MSLSIEINGVPVNVTRGSGGRYFFQMAHMLRAAGIPDGLGFAMWAGANKSGHGTMSLDGVSMGHPVRFISIEGYRAYVSRWRARIDSGSMDAKRRKDPVLYLWYLWNLESCLSVCEDWIRAREQPCKEDRPGEAPAEAGSASNADELSSAGRLPFLELYGTVERDLSGCVVDDLTETYAKAADTLRKAKAVLEKTSAMLNETFVLRSKRLTVLELLDGLGLDRACLPPETLAGMADRTLFDAIGSTIA